MFKKFLIIAAVLGLAACSSSVRDQAQLRYGTYDSDDEAQLNELVVKIRTNQPHNLGSDSVSSEARHSPITHKKLSKVFREWAGTRYRMGGTSKRGIDCSAFMQETFEKAFGMSLPRSTSEQRHLGKSIAKSQLKSGDLVFFRRNSHVGVYIGNGRFMHASSSQGVTISSLDESYWARSYSQSRRIL